MASSPSTSAAPPPARLRTRAFGLDLDAGFDLPGFTPSPRPMRHRPTMLDRLNPETLAQLCAGGEWTRLSDLTAPDGTRLVEIDADEGHGFRIWAEGFGDALVAPDGRGVHCAPVERPDWRWQRYLIGQVLPFAAVLQGLEVFHASAVVIEGRAVAVAAHTGSGKTSLALNLALRGLPFLTDDVLVVEPDGQGLTVHPGAGLANVRRPAQGLAEEIEHRGLGRRLGETGDDIRVTVERHPDAVPLGALFFLERSAEGERAAIERLSPVDPRLLLAGTFNLVLRHPARLARQLDVCARIARSALVYRVTCPPAVDAASLAAQIAERAYELGAAR